MKLRKFRKPSEAKKVAITLDSEEAFKTVDIKTSNNFTHRNKVPFRKKRPRRTTAIIQAAFCRIHLVRMGELMTRFDVDHLKKPLSPSSVIATFSAALCSVRVAHVRLLRRRRFLRFFFVYLPSHM
jgi:hypothetical protein